MIPEKPQDGDWLAWCDRNYPFDPRWERHLLTRTERPKPATEQQLNDLRGIADRSMATHLAQLWFYGVENRDRIEAEQKRTRDLENEKDRTRLVRLSKLALDGKLGETHDERDAAKATAQNYIGSMPPERCSVDELQDWEKMHRYARAVSKGEPATRPTLSRDLKQQARQRRELAEIDEALGSERYEQRSLGGM